MIPNKYIPELENKDLLWISYDMNIPANYNGISVKLGLNKNGEIIAETIKHERPDPSTIWVYLPVKPAEYALPLPYFPHYIDLSPQQRYTYLNWLRDIDTQIDTGYVFLYFYGLERHLLIGDIERAIKQIIRLRNIHLNKSFQAYSRNSIIHACIMRGRIDLLADIHNQTDIQDFSNAQILLAHNFGFGLSAGNLIDLFYKFYPKSRKAIKENRVLLFSSVEKTLIDQYGITSMPLNDVNVSKTPVVREIRFCNYTFPDDIRFVKITDYSRCKSFMKKVDNIFDVSYNNYKVENRKSKKYENKS